MTPTDIWVEKGITCYVYAKTQRKRNSAATNFIRIFQFCLKFFWCG